MRRSRAYLIAALSSALIVLVIHGVRSHQAPWKTIQRQFNVLQRTAGLPGVSLGIRSIQTRTGRRQERCVTCHLGMILPWAHGAPFQAHPPLDCSLAVERMGCIDCHRGDPLRLTVEGAHGLNGDASRRVLDLDGDDQRRQRLQPGCAQCHLSRRAGQLQYDEQVVPRVALGLDLFLRQGCPSCHRIAGLVSLAEHGPRLDQVGARRTRREILRLVQQPQQESPSSPMPPVRLPPAELEALVLFLQAQIGPDNEAGSGAGQVLASTGSGSQLSAEPISIANAAAGALSARKLGCQGCHRLAGHEAGIADLRHVGWYRSTTELKQSLQQPQKQFKGTYMPQMNLTPDEVESLVLYLELQKTPLPSSAGQVFDQICAKCHGSARDSKAVVLARTPPQLSRRRVSAKTFSDTLTQGRQGTAMPPWGRVMSRAFIDSLFEELPP